MSERVQELECVIADLTKQVQEARAENEKLRGQSAMNGRLLTENAELREEIRIVGLQMDRMADEIEKLRAALKPFAGHSARFTQCFDETSQILLIKVCDLRAAAAALKEDG